MGALDALFFNSLDEARRTIRDFSEARTEAIGDHPVWQRPETREVAVAEVEDLIAACKSADENPDAWKQIGLVRTLLY